MIIAGVVIDVKPEQAGNTAVALHRRPGVTRVQGPVSPGRLVAVVEAADNRELDLLVEEILALDGIINVSPAYIHFGEELLHV